MLEGHNADRQPSQRQRQSQHSNANKKPMKINSDFTKTLLGMAAKTTLEKLANSAATASQNAPEDGGVLDPEPTEVPFEARQKNTLNQQPQEPFAQVLKGIGTQVTAAVTDGLSSQMDKKVAEAVDVAELAIERQRVAALKQMELVLAAERTKTVDALQKTAAALSHRIFVSAVLIGGSLLMVAAALLLHK